MFNSKKTTLFSATENQTTSASTMVVLTQPFLKAAYKQSVTTNSLGNKATKLTTTGSNFVDQFAKATNYKTPRQYSEINSDMSLLWSQNPLMTVCLLFYLRMITRVVTFFDGTKTSTSQRGQGLKHEGIFRMMWVAINAPETFWKNITLFISIGSWKDIITMLSYDLQYNGWNNKVLDWNKFGQLILAGLENPKTSELVKKYLPQIKSNSQCKTLEAQADNIIAKWVCSLLFGGKTQEDSYRNYRSYRKLKSSGTAHQWQQLISQKRFLEIDFNTVHGRALAQMVSGKFLANQGLETLYEQWIEAQPVAKYTGYVYELLAPVKPGYNNADLKKYQIDTINKQFYNLIEVAKNGMKPDATKFIAVVDTSSSMTDLVPGTKISSYSVAKSMALYFSYLLNGPFKKAWIEFNDTAKLHIWKGKTPVENLQNDSSEAYGSTNFLGVAQLFAQMKNEQNVNESDFPTGIVCFSDGCFNSTPSNKSNYQQFKSTLTAAGFSKDFVDKFQIVLWDIPNGYYGKSQTAFEEFADCPGMLHISGLDPAAIAFLTGVEGQVSVPKTSDELFLAAMNQEVLNKIQI